MDEKTKRHIEIIEEAVRIMRDYPELTHQEALDKAKEVLGYEEGEDERRENSNSTKNKA